MSLLVRDEKAAQTFQTCLARGECWTSLPWIVSKLKAYFADFKELIVIPYRPESSWAQTGGIDAVIVLNSGKVVSVDVKTRTSDYADIALEVISNSTTNRPGWIEQRLATDFLAYAVTPTRRLFIFPFLQLQRAWALNKARWLERYGMKAASTRGNGWATLFQTMFCPVPLAVLTEAIGETVNT